MRLAIGPSAALLLGFGILELGDGLQGTLLGVRASMESFPTAVTGVVMSMFYVGFLGGCIHVDRLVARIGHVRAFGVLASVASAAVLLHAVFPNPLAWGALRLVSGYCFPGLYVVAESWLNARATNETRGQLLSIYSSAAMSIAGHSAFYWTLAVVHAAIGIFALNRMTRRASPPVETQAPYAPAAPQSSQVAIEWSQHAARQCQLEEDS